MRRENRRRHPQSILNTSSEDEESCSWPTGDGESSVRLPKHASIDWSRLDRSIGKNVVQEKKVRVSNQGAAHTRERGSPRRSRRLPACRAQMGRVPRPTGSTSSFVCTAYKAS